MRDLDELLCRYVVYKFSVCLVSLSILSWALRDVPTFVFSILLLLFLNFVICIIGGLALLFILLFFRVSIKLLVVCMYFENAEIYMYILATSRGCQLEFS